MRTIMDRCEVFAAAVAEARTARHNGISVRWWQFARERGVDYDNLRRACDPEYRAKRNRRAADWRNQQRRRSKLARIVASFKPKAPEFGIEAVTRTVQRAITVGGDEQLWTDVSVARVRWLERPIP